MPIASAATAIGIIPIASAAAAIFFHQVNLYSDINLCNTYIIHDWICIV